MESCQTAAIIPRVCIDDLSTSVNVDFPCNTRDLALCVFGQHLKAQTTSGMEHMEYVNNKTNNKRNKTNPGNRKSVTV